MFKKKYVQYLLIILSFIAFSLISDICIIHTHVLFSTDDFPFHLKRIMELYKGSYFSSFSFNYFHGSAVMGMYPYYSLFPLMLLLHVTSSYVWAYYYFFIFIVLTTLLISFFCSLKFSKSKSVSYLFAILYTFSVAFLINYFYDGDLGITTSLMFLPIVLFGFLDIINGSKNYIKLSLGIVLMLLCQLPTTIIIGAFLSCLILININKIKKPIFFRFVKVVILVVLLSSIVWVPMLKIILFNKITTPTSSQLKGASIISIIKNVGIIPILFIPISLLYFKQFNKIIKQMYCISIIIIVTASSYIPLIKYIASFKFLHFINTFQFTARFLIIPQIIFCYLSSWIIMKWISKLKRFKWLFSGAIILMLLLQISTQGFIVHKEFNQNYKYANSYQSINISGLMGHGYMIKVPWIKYLSNGRLNNTDYYPKAATPRVNYINNNEATYGHNRTVNVKHTGYNRFSFDSPKRINRLALPLLHYNGEHLRVYVNHHLVHSHANGNSLVTLDNVKKGRSVVGVRSVPIGWVMVSKIILFMLGVIWIMGHFINIEFRNMNIDEKIAAGILGIILAFSLIHLFLTGQWYDTLISVLISALFYCLELGTDGPTTEILMSFYDDYVNKSIVTIANNDGIKDIYRVDDMSDAVSENDLTTYFDAINLWSQKVNLYMTKGQTQNLAKQLPHFDRFKEFMKTYTRAKNTGFNGLRAVNNVDEAERLMERIK